MLYSYKGRYPTTIPSRLRLSDGTTRTGYEYTEKELTDAGWSVVEDKPMVDMSLQGVNWNGSTLVWDIYDIPQPTVEELQARANAKQIEDAQYLLDTTDWIVTKISEAQLRNEDISELMLKYEQELQSRVDARTVINNLEIINIIEE